jgi:hypothetical protein
MRLGGTDLEAVLPAITASKVDSIASAAGTALDLGRFALSDASAGDGTSL